MRSSWSFEVATTLTVSAVTQIAKFPEPEMRIVHTAANPAPTTRELNLGSLEVDLSDLPPATTSLTYRYLVDVGQLRVQLPKEGNFEIRYRTDLGRVSAPGIQTKSGSDLSGTTKRITDPAAPRTVLDLRVQLGDIEVIE